MQPLRVLLAALFSLLCCSTLLLSQAPKKRKLDIDDQHRFVSVGDPHCSPDAKWIAYTVGTTDAKEEKRDTDIWMVAADGSKKLRMTSSLESESSPRWSPDGKYLSFTSSRPGKAKGSQVWAMDREGGEATQLTEITKLRISGYEWSPDAKRLALLMREPDEPEPDAAKDDDRQRPRPAAPDANPAAKPKPIVIDRYHFKQDIQGYLTSTKKTRIYLFDIATKKPELLTTTEFDESGVSWSPDGSKIAFLSNHEPDWDRNPNSDVWVVDAKPGSTPKKISTHNGQDSGRVAWSPDSKWVAWLQGLEPKLGAYNMNRLVIAPADGSAKPTMLTASLDNTVSNPSFTADGSALTFLVTDDRTVYPARVSVRGGAVEKLATGQKVYNSYDATVKGCTAAIISDPHSQGEIFAITDGGPKKVTDHHEATFSPLELGQVEGVEFKSKDGVTDVHAVLTKPVGYEAGKKYPMLLLIHGGPNGQDAYSFSFQNQFFAANGYAVLNVNYRGSNGRGTKFQTAIFGDWGHHEVEDLLGGVDHLVKIGIADPDKLGIGGWSYGGILTDYTTASDTRFKAAVSGAGSALQLTMYGTDQYTYQYDNEIGQPWKDPVKWIKISYPFFHADRIVTPTLYMGGQSDFNVPIAGGEQMYQALKSIGKVPTQLVIYPAEFHGIQRASFQKDRLERWLAWFDKHIRGIEKPEKKEAPVTGATGSGTAAK